MVITTAVKKAPKAVINPTALILTTKENTKLVRRLLVERLRELYGDIIPPNQSLEKVFKIEKVSHEYTIKSKS